MAKQIFQDFDTPGKVIIDVVLILDKSASMLRIWPQTIKGLNEYITSLRVGMENDKNLEYRVSITAFGHEIEKLHARSILDRIPTFTEKNIIPDGGSTALYDAVGMTLKELSLDNPVLFVVITDGEENSSRTFINQEEITKLINEKKALGNYTFVYLGADPSAWSGGLTFTTTGNSYKGTSATVPSSFRDLSTGTLTYTANVSSVLRSRSATGDFSQGSLSTNSFYSSASSDMLSGVEVPTSVSDATGHSEDLTKEQV